jgi:hypothetical protein
MGFFSPRRRIGRRPNRVVLRVTRLEDRRTPAAFAGVSQQDESNIFGSTDIPPDTMGAVGPGHFMEVINGAVAIYNKASTARVSLTSLDSFFTFTANGNTFPRNGAFDPRVLYDVQSGHWFASALEFGANSQTDNDMLLAVSRTSDPTGTWDKYDIPVGVINALSDFDTLGVDSNGVYLACRIFPNTGSDFAKIVATPKAPLIAASPSIGTITQFSNITNLYSTPQPAYDMDAISATSPEFFVASSASVSANVAYRTLTWNNGTPTLSGTKTLTTAAYGGGPPSAPASGSSTPIDTGDDRMQAVLIRNHQLWTSRTIGVDAGGGSTNTSRAAVEWFDLNANTSTLSVTQTGRIFDNAASNPRFYFYPSIAVTGQGNMRISFSGAKSTEFIGAYTSGRLASDPNNTVTAPTLIKAGERSYNEVDGSGSNRWGDYSFSSTDPSDDMTAWTVQEYSSNVNPSVDNWGSWIQSIAAPAPTLNNPSAAGTQAQTGVTLNLTGTGFFDPGASFPNHVGVQLTGGSVNGITNVVTTYNSPTSVTVTFNIAANASPGSRTIVLTNPDGQTATVANGFTVNAATPVTVQSLAVNDGSAQRSEVQSLTVTFSGPVTFAGGNGNAAAAFQLQHQTNGNNVTLAAAVSTNGSGQTVVLLTFSGPETDPVTSGEPMPSLADGIYTLTVFAANVTGANGLALDGNGDGTAGDDYHSPADSAGGTGPHLFRLYGDIDGSGVVNAFDYGQFRLAYGSSSADPAYLAAFDADGSGAINAFDYGQFRLRYGISLF